MRHRVAHRKLGRVTEHRIALLRNQATALIRHERIETTVPKAKELRPFVERIITIAKRGLASGEANGRLLNARRLVLQDIQDRGVVGKLFDDIAPRFAARPGGYTRLLKVGFRRGDSAEVAQIELVGSEYDPNAEVEKVDAGDKPAPKKGLGARLKATADRVRGKKDDGSSPAPKSSTRAAGGRKVSTPRKSGGGS